MQMYRLSRITPALACALLLPAFAQQAHAQVVEQNPASGDLATKWKVNDDNPTASIPSEEERFKNPLEFGYFMQDLLARGEYHLALGDWNKVVKYYEAVATAVPDSWIGFNRLCLAYGQLGKHELAAANCGKAVSLPRARVLDHIRLIENTLQSSRFTQREIDSVESSLHHLREHIAKNPQPPAPGQLRDQQSKDGQANENKAAGSVALSKEQREAAAKKAQERYQAGGQRKPQVKLDIDDDDANREPAPARHLPTHVAVLTCKFGIRIQDAARVSGCLDELRSFKYDERELLGLTWAHALIAKDKKRAESVLERYRQLGVPEAALAGMISQQQAMFPAFNVARLWPLAALGVLASAAFWLLRMRRRKLAGGLPA
jgi:tetratricopeptide (TPR) repeat protein